VRRAKKDGSVSTSSCEAKFPHNLTDTLANGIDKEQCALKPDQRQPFPWHYAEVID